MFQGLSNLIIIIRLYRTCITHYFNFYRETCIASTYKFKGMWRLIQSKLKQIIRKEWRHGDIAAGIGSHQIKDRQCNGQNKPDKWTSNGHKIIHKKLKIEQHLP